MKVSIITPSYNQGQFIEKTIQSVLNQTYANIEYIIVDGGSTDNTMEIVNKYKEHIDIIIHEKDKGQSDAINKGFKLASGVLVGWINSDDLLFPECVEKIVELASQHPDGNIFYPSIIDLIDEEGTITGKIERKIYNKQDLIDKDYSIIQQGSFYKASAVRTVNFLNEEIHYCMDLDLWLRLLGYGGIHFLKGKPFAAFRIWEDSKTTTGGGRFLNDIKKTLRRHKMKKFSANSIRLHTYLVKSTIKSAFLKYFKVAI